MKQGLSLRTSQHLVLTPQLQQSIRLLQLSTLELGQEVEQMLDENPFLERASEEQEADIREIPDLRNNREAVQDGGLRDATDNSDPIAIPIEYEEPSWEGDGTYDLAPDDGEWGIEAPARPNNLNQDATDSSELARSHESLQSYLHRQALELHLGALDAHALRFLIESLNEDGYLEDPLEALAHALAGDDNHAIEPLLKHFTTALRYLHQLEPAGVGARNLAECLRLQIQQQLHDELKPPASKAKCILHTALRICEQPMDLLARRDIKTLVQRCHANDASVREAIAFIARLEPKPGRRFVDVERHIVVPDVLVQTLPKTRLGAAPQFRITLNPDVLPRLRVHDIYANVLRNHRSTGNDASTHAALQQRLQEARWFIKNIQQRFDTILRVSMAIVDRQKNFFTHGELAMRPLVLREIADELGLHESTISRVTTAKYMATPFGTFELKYFFGSGLGTDSGGNASSTAVRALIKQFISAESHIKPLSDNQISEMLKEQGIDCARRTVAKYREGLKIASASLRKAL